MELRRFKIRKYRKKVYAKRIYAVGGRYSGINSYFDVMPVDPKLTAYFRMDEDELDEGWMRVQVGFMDQDPCSTEDLIRACSHCNHQFVSLEQSTRYCSKECYRAAYKARNPKPNVEHKNIRCDHCGNWFQPVRSTAKFCSARCRVAANRAKSAKKKSVKKRRVRAK